MEKQENMTVREAQNILTGMRLIYEYSDRQNTALQMAEEALEICGKLDNMLTLLETRWREHDRK